MVENALIKQVSAAIPDLYLKQFCNVYSHAITTPLATLLSQLMTTYGRVDDNELQRVTSTLKDKVYDLTEPLIGLFNDVKELKSLSITAENEYTKQQLVNFGIHLIKNMQDFKQALETWYALPLADRTWI